MSLPVTFICWAVRLGWLTSFLQYRQGVRLLPAAHTNRYVSRPALTWQKLEIVVDANASLGYCAR